MHNVGNSTKPLSSFGFVTLDFDPLKRFQIYLYSYRQCVMLTVSLFQEKVKVSNFSEF